MMVIRVTELGLFPTTVKVKSVNGCGTMLLLGLFAFVFLLGVFAFSSLVRSVW